MLTCKAASLTPFNWPPPQYHHSLFLQKCSTRIKLWWRAMIHPRWTMVHCCWTMVHCCWTMVQTHRTMIHCCWTITHCWWTMIECRWTIVHCYWTMTYKCWPITYSCWAMIDSCLRFLLIETFILFIYTVWYIYWYEKMPIHSQGH